jgi:hypothetical protein
MNEWVKNFESACEFYVFISFLPETIHNLISQEYKVIYKGMSHQKYKSYH